MSEKEDFQKYRVMNSNGEPKADERYHINIEMQEDLHARPSIYIVQRTRHLNADVEIRRWGTNRGVRFSTTDSVSMNVLRIMQLAIPVGHAITVETSGPDGWKAMREIMHVLSHTAPQTPSIFRGDDPVRGGGSSLAQGLYDGYMSQGCEINAQIHQEILETWQSVLEPGGIEKMRTETSVSCTRCGTVYPLLTVVLVSKDAGTVWAGDTLCEFCFRDVT